MATAIFLPAWHLSRGQKGASMNNIMDPILLTISSAVTS